MAKRKTKKEKKEYTVLIPITNGKTGKDYAPGETIEDGDFPKAIIENWLGITPPVLEVKS